MTTGLGQKPHEGLLEVAGLADGVADLAGLPRLRATGLRGRWADLATPARPELAELEAELTAAVPLEAVPTLGTAAGAAAPSPATPVGSGAWWRSEPTAAGG